MIIVIIYVVGFFLTLTFFKFFGKKLGLDRFDYKTRFDYDYDNTAQMYAFYAAIWPAMWIMGLIFGTATLVYKFVQWFLNL